MNLLIYGATTLLVLLSLWSVGLLGTIGKMMQCVKHLNRKCRIEDKIQAGFIFCFTVFGFSVLLFFPDLITKYVSLLMTIDLCTTVVFYHFSQQLFFNLKSIKKVKI